jgi:signal transduction histidine kinase
MSDSRDPDERADPPATLDDADVDQLLTEVIGRVHGVADERARWELLLEAVVTMAADLSLDGLLERIVAIASRLAGARYAALGVLDASGHGLRTFVHHGIDAELAREIGALPSGHGLLGLIIERPAPLRLHDLTQHPASYGFPPGHPPMHSFLGVPVRTRDKVFGNLYLTEKVGGGDFTEQDERIVVALAAAAGVAVENAQLYADVRRRERWLAATAEVTAVLLAQLDPKAALQAIVDRAAGVAQADAAWIASGPSDDEHIGDLTVEVWSGPEVDPKLCRVLAWPLVREVAETGVPRAVEDLALEAEGGERGPVPESPGPESPRPGCLGLGPAILVPLSTATGFTGVLALAWSPQNAGRQLDLDPALPASFARQAALSFQVARANEDQQRLVIFEERDRIGRDLHDLVIQRLFATGLSLQGASRLADLPELRWRLESAVDDLDATIKDIRSTIFGLGSNRNTSDLRTEVTRLVRRAAATLKFEPTVSFNGPVPSVVDPEVGADLLAVLSEALSNTARHARASQVHVSISANDEITLEIVDDGAGIPPGVTESGLRNMRERAERRGGSFAVGPGALPGGTHVRWSVPLAAAMTGS